MAWDWLGWCLVALGLAVWAIVARGFADELGELVRRAPSRGGRP
jgi:hypothetical protein